MPIPSSKKELSETLTVEFKKLMDELQTIPSALTREKSIEGKISVCDCLAYQIGWGRLLINWYQTGKKEQMPVLPCEGYRWNQLGALAEHFYRTHHKDSYNKLMTEFTTVYKNIQQIISENSDKELYSLGVYNWTGDKWPLGRYINVNTSSPYKSARAKIRAWKKLKKIS